MAGRSDVLPGGGSVPIAGLYCLLADGRGPPRLTYLSRLDPGGVLHIGMDRLRGCGLDLSMGGAFRDLPLGIHAGLRRADLLGGDGFMRRLRGLLRRGRLVRPCFHR